ncbi:response regulator [Pseudomonas aeruginosa]
MEQQSDGLKVMVIDDSKTIRRTAETLLKKVGCDVITAIDGFDALAKIADTHPNIIFVDIQETDKVWGKRQGARDYLTKPVDEETLLKTINAVLAG